MNVRFTVLLTVGARFRYDGKTWTVTEMGEGGPIYAKSTVGDRIVVDLQQLVTHPTFESLDLLGGSRPTTSLSLEKLVSSSALASADAKTAHVLEVLTGFRSGDAKHALPNEPRPEYAPALPQGQRIRAKAAEIGKSERTIEAWISAWRKSGPLGLVDGSLVKARVEIFSLWRETAAIVLAERVGQTRVGRHVVIPTITERLRAEKPDAPIPKRAKQYEILKELDRNNQYFTGTTKTQRGRAAVPEGVYGYKDARRPGQFLVLDTSPLDVFAMDSITGKWLRCQLTLAMDWCTRCIVGLSLTPYSVKAKDVASALYQVVMPRQRIQGKPWPYVGVPDVLVVDAAKTEFWGRALGPALYPEGIVVDHGKQYISRHVWGACLKFGIHVQPARKGRGSDKGILERYFRTIREGFLEYLTGYMGPDLSQRGRDVEAGAFYFMDELEQLLRDWIEEHYHHRPHQGLQSEHAPGVDLTPAQMYELRVGVTGPIRVPARPDLAVDFLPVEYRMIHHYGVQLAGLKYSGPILKGRRKRPGPIGGDVKARRKWPIAYDPDDIRTIFIQIEDGSWHALTWNKAHTLGGPFSLDQLRATKAIIDPLNRRRTPTPVEDILARLPLASATTVAERRVTVRASAMNRDKLTQDTRAFAIGGLDTSNLAAYENIAQIAARDVATFEIDDWDDLLASDDSTFREA
ncbi:DDE-type integrase/transposase/recombinase [Cellulomonas hominis]|uniref:DDE-type integrase/transposase/recombinase n=1 Tax=Cellulomonas hominis TaxID=156981 RepID=A0A7Z8NRY5_9CELL|nr:Mu transposase C-terminal domain-containing protein [Cellulomonas hominis]TKR27328.1 DDE-type integrase/transposase/recombinase [Cellulomonas hominis]